MLQPSGKTFDQSAKTRAAPAHGKVPLWRTALKGIVDGGPCTCHFAITSVCNARCSFCNFAVDRLPKHAQASVGLEDAKEALEILARNSVRYIFFIGGEPMVHRDLVAIVAHAKSLSMSPVVVTNGWFLNADRVDALAEAGLTSYSISIDAPSAEVHDNNRGLPGLTSRIRAANALCAARGIPTIASVTMSRLVGDYEALPEFLTSLGFRAVTFSYPLASLASSYLGFRDSKLVTYSPEELLEAYEAVKRLKKRFPVLNPTASLEDMQRHVRGEPEKFGCLGGHKFFYLDWHLNIYRCHNWQTPMCHIRDFDNAPRIRDGCTACMTDCYRDDSVMQHIGVAVSDGVHAAARGHLGEALRHWTDKRNATSLGAVLEEAPIWRTMI
jgi:MoaA/NifB/PqqE/SkfB family radical SAM enzyme